MSAFDAELKALESLLGGETVQRMIAIFLSDLKEHRPLLVNQAIAADPEGARRAAHDLVTNAGSLGFLDLSEKARALEHAILGQNGDAILTLSRDIEALAEDAETALAAYRQREMRDHDEDGPHR